MAPAIDRCPPSTGAGVAFDYAPPPMSRTPALLLFLAACGTSPSTETPIADRSTPVVTRAAPGTVVVLDPMTADGVDELDTTAADGLLREAMRQSAQLDVASGVESTRTGRPHRIAIHLDAPAAVLSATLRRDGAPPEPLCTVTSAWPGLADAFDRLAAGIRQALGDDPNAAGGDDRTRSVAAIYSREARTLIATEAAIRASAEGRVRAALPLLRRARQGDPGCTFTLALLAETLLELGGADEYTAARDTAREALGYEARLSPTTRHRLARTLILADARLRRGIEPAQKLAELAAAGARERPFDPHVKFTAALAGNLAGDFAATAPALRELSLRWPQSGPVVYHLALAELGLGRAAESLTAIESCRDRLPRWHVLVPRALALHGAQRDTELSRELEEVAAEPAVRNSILIHEVRRMQAAHALLTGRRDAAVSLLLEDIEWLRQRPTQIEGLALDLAEAGMVLAWLDQGAALAPHVEALQKLRLSPLGESVTTLLAGLVAAGADLPSAAAAQGLERSGAEVFARIVEAAAHRRRGELLAEVTALGRAALGTEDPLVIAGLARALRQSGRDAEARELLDELRTRLTRLDLRRLREQPLASPGRALALLAAQR